MKTVTKENFHEKTKADFKFISYNKLAEEMFNELVKENGLFFKSNSGSQYVVVNDTVYRYSNHWGNVATCKWSIVNTPNMPTWRTNNILAKCDLNDFISMKKEVEYVVFDCENKKMNRTYTAYIPSAEFCLDKLKEVLVFLTEPKKVIILE
jgi:hypothetical protein